VRREGDAVVFLNALRFRDDPPLTLRRSLSEGSLPAARAARGEEGIFEGLDYRGTPILAALRAVPDSPWKLVARMDLAELHAPLEARLWQQVTVVGALLLAAGATLSLLWRREVNRFYRERYEAAEALRASEVALRARNDELTRFTYTVSHDLKSPLVTIQTFAGYLARDLAARDADGTARDLGFIRGAADKMGRLLDDLLALSRVGRKANPPEDVRLQEVVAEALALVAGQVTERGARIEVTPESVVLRGDRQRLVEIFQNLLDNAVKFSRPGCAPLVQIGVETAGEELVLFVRDDGLGIDPRHASRLFGLFEKLDASAEGTGIGLALVRRIVEVHGGRIWAESAGPGAGTCFRFTLAGTRRAPEGSVA
jgi:signal transduction histidine kinase